MQKESSTYPPFFRQLKNQPNTNNAHFLEDLQKSTHPSHFSGKKLRQKKSRTNITHNFLTSCVFKKSCRSKLMVRIRAVAHELQSCSTSSFRSGEVANPAIRGAKAKGANKNGSFFEVWEVFFFLRKLFLKQKTHVIEDQATVRCWILNHVKSTAIMSVISCFGIQTSA